MANMRVAPKAASRTSTKVTYYGPFFDGDPAKRVGQNIESLLRAINKDAAEMMRSQFVPGQASELRATVAERHVTLYGRTYSMGVYSTMTGPDSRSPNPHSWVTFAETGRRRVNGANVQTRFRGFKQWTRVRLAMRRWVKDDEKVRQMILRGVA